MHANGNTSLPFAWYQDLTSSLSLCHHIGPKCDNREYVNQHYTTEGKRVKNDLAKATLVSILPIPNLLEEVAHVDFFGFHLNHPWMLKHAPWRRTSRAILLETTLNKVLEVL